MILDNDDKVLAYTRSYENNMLVVLNNFYGEETVVELPKELLQNKKSSILLSNYKDSKELSEKISIRPYESVVYYIEK